MQTQAGQQEMERVKHGEVGEGSISRTLACFLRLQNSKDIGARFV